MNDDTPIRAALAELPDLPKPRFPDAYMEESGNWVDAFDAEQMQDYACAARLALAATEPAKPVAWMVTRLMRRGQEQTRVRYVHLTKKAADCDYESWLDIEGSEPKLVPLYAEQSRSASSLTESAAREPFKVGDRVAEGVIERQSPGGRDSFVAGEWRFTSDLRPAATEIRAAPSEPVHQAAQEVVSWMDYAGFDTTYLPSDEDGTSMGESLRNLRKLLVADRLRPSAVLEAAPLTDERATKIWNEAYEASQAYYRGKHEPAYFSAVFVREVLARASTPSPSPTGEKP